MVFVVTLQKFRRFFFKLNGDGLERKGNFGDFGG